MRYLLDTHALLWVSNDPKKLSARAKAILTDGSQIVFVSAVSAWEIATKVRLKKLQDPSNLSLEFESVLEREGYRTLDMKSTHALRAGSFLEAHQDPFDRILAAQALLENLTLISADEQLDRFKVKRVW